MRGNRMINEDALEIIKYMADEKRASVTTDNSNLEALETIISAFESYKAFAEWVTDEIFDEMWAYNKDAFAEVACRKLVKLGLVKEVDKLGETRLYEKVEQKHCDNENKGDYIEFVDLFLN